jgi:hypothetical protein
VTMMSDLTPVYIEIILDRPFIDELRDFGSLVVRIRGKQHSGINIEFHNYLIYRKMDESWAIDTTTLLCERIPVSERFHWLYETRESEFLASFEEANQHRPSHWKLRHFIVVTGNDLVEVIAGDPPEISERTDTIRGWIGPGEELSSE